MTNLHQTISTFLFAALCLGVNPACLSGQSLQPDNTITELAGAVVKENAAPGVIAAIAKADQPIRIGATGVRKAGDNTAMTTNDLVHLGSCTKAITATMIARMVQRRELSWQTTIADGLPDMRDAIHAGYHAATIEQLLKHKAGVPANGPWFLKTGKTVSDDRQAIIVQSLSDKPESDPGTKYRYSNLGYMIAGFIAARKRKTSWEELVTSEIFEPLGLATAGFGPPGSEGKVDQPWGHNLRPDDRFWPVQRDNAPTLGPAGTVHMSIADWATFASTHLSKSDSEFLQAKTLAKLHDPDPDSNYALGWIVVERSAGQGKVLTHSGSNTMWFATIRVLPQSGSIYLAAANAAGKKTAAQIDALIDKMMQLD